MKKVLLAINWLEQQEKIISETDRALTSEEQVIAKQVGVANPERVYILEVTQIQRPEDVELAALCQQHYFLTEDTIGLTLGYAIYIKKGYLTTRLLSHELRHVYQYEQAGSAEVFLTRYIGEIMQYGYINAPLEVDARAHEINESLEYVMFDSVARI